MDAFAFIMNTWDDRHGFRQVPRRASAGMRLVQEARDVSLLRLRLELHVSGDSRKLSGHNRSVAKTDDE